LLEREGVGATKKGEARPRNPRKREKYIKKGKLRSSEKEVVRHAVMQ